MDENTFWTMIESAKRQSAGEDIKQYQLLVERLSELPERDILDYARIFYEIRARTYRGDIWAAAIFILEYGSDDGFMDFRAWLISQGRPIFEKALENPDSLAEVVDSENRGNQSFEEFAYIASDAYKRKTGNSLPDMPFTPPELDGEIISHVEWSDVFPRLTEKLGYDPDEWDDL